MNVLAIAKGRARRRRGQAGAAMFIVAMTLVVLASVGVYALTAAATEVRTSGNERQSSQTHYMASYGIIGVAHEIIASKAQYYLGLMQVQPDTCPLSLPGVSSTAAIQTRACRRLGVSELGTWGSSAITSYTGSAPLSTTVAPGSFGPVQMNGGFFVELTEPTQANPPGRYALDLHFCFIQFTATSSGLTQPLFPNATDPDTPMYGGEGVEVQRARIVAGPVQCPR